MNLSDAIRDALKGQGFNPDEQPEAIAKGIEFMGGNPEIPLLIQEGLIRQIQAGMVAEMTKQSERKSFAE